MLSDERLEQIRAISALGLVAHGTREALRETLAEVDRLRALNMAQADRIEALTGDRNALQRAVDEQRRLIDTLVKQYAVPT